MKTDWKVYIVTHVDYEKTDSAKNIWEFSSHEKALDAIDQASKEPWFRDALDKFEIQVFEVGVVYDRDWKEFNIL